MCGTVPPSPPVQYSHRHAIDRRYAATDQPYRGETPTRLDITHCIPLGWATRSRVTALSNEEPPPPRGEDEDGGPPIIRPGRLAADRLEATPLE